MTIDMRAARAVRAMKRSVAAASPPDMRTVSRRHVAAMLTSFAGAFAVVILTIGVAMALPTFFSPDQPANEATHSTIGDLTTLPGDDPAVVPGDEVDHESGPRQSSSVSDDPVPFTTFFGHAEPGLVVTASSEFGSASTAVHESGEWWLKLEFDDPPSGVEFPIILALGGDTYEFTFTWLWNPEDVDITAHQALGISDDPEPYEVFEGTAPPGTFVAVTSEHGNGEDVADDYGQWRVKVWLHELPFDTPVPMTVTVGDQVFDFTFRWVFEGEEGDDGGETPTSSGVTVHQNNTISDSAEPYTRFFGTAPQGTHIVAISEFGSADLVTEVSGEWDLKLWFGPDLPVGETIPVTVKVDGDIYGTYGFKWLYEPPSFDLTVHQQNTTSDGPEPYVKFYGTAPQGTTIVILTEYGAADLLTEHAGEWALKAWLHDLPVGEPINVTVKVNGAVYGTYSFTWLYDPSQVEFTITQHNAVSDGPEPYTKFFGTAPPGTHIAAISEYGSAEKTVGESGEWLLEVWFTEPPVNVSIPVTVKVDGDVYETYSFKWVYDSSAVEETAHATFGECAEAEPYDVYYGTASPGTEVTISSPYGGASTTANAEGHWEKKVFFDPPIGETFTVTVNVGGEVFYFSFVATGGA